MSNKDKIPNGKKYIMGIDPYDVNSEAKVFSLSKERIKELLKDTSRQGLTFVNSNKVENYKIIKDEGELQKFIQFLPDLEPEQKFYYCLFARKKYGATEGLTSDKCQLKRGTTTKERMLRDFKKLEVQLGLYELNDIPINQGSLVMYISPNPTDMHKASLKTAKQIVSDMVDGKRIKSPIAIGLNEIQTNVVKKYFNIDVDFKQNGLNYNDVENMIRRRNYVNNDAMTFIATRGGFHILVEYSKIDKDFEKKWYRNFNLCKSDMFDVDMNNGSGLTPIPGCVQSNFVPHILP